MQDRSNHSQRGGPRLRPLGPPRPPAGQVHIACFIALQAVMICVGSGSYGEAKCRNLVL
jgi:hypothetical protein